MRLLVGCVLIAFTAFLVGVIYYLSIPTAAPVPVPVAISEPSPAHEPHAGIEGQMETVMTPPKTFNGRFSPESDSPDDFSSNPKRDPAEQQVIDLAGDRNLSDRAKVDRLLTMIPNLPDDAQTLAMENATALIPDADYSNYRQRILQLAKSPEMREAVMDDSLTRGEELRLPNLLELMRSSTSEAEKQEIREIFEAYLDKDYGPHPSQWEIPLSKWVAENSGK